MAICCSVGKDGDEVLIGDDNGDTLIGDGNDILNGRSGDDEGGLGRQLNGGPVMMS